MRYFKDENEKLYEFGVTKIFPDNFIEITKDEFNVMQEKQNEIEVLMAKYKKFLRDTDFKVLPDYTGDTTGIIEERENARVKIKELENGIII